MSVIDRRKQERIIKIHFEQKGYSKDLDELIDEIVKDIEVVVLQRNLENINVRITLRWTTKEMNKITEKALRFATYKHKGQLDDSGVPYIGHPMQTAHIVSIVAPEDDVKLPELSSSVFADFQVIFVPLNLKNELEPSPI